MKTKVLIIISIPALLIVCLLVVNLINKENVINSNNKFESFAVVQSSAENESEEIIDSSVYDSTEITEESSTEFVPLRESDALSSYLGKIVIAFNIESDLYKQVISSVYNKIDDSKAIYVFGAGFSREGPYIAYTVYDSVSNSFTDIDDILVEDEINIDDSVVVYESRDALINSRK